jgi:hypothetical protein
MVVLARGLYSVNDRITQVSQSMQTLATASSEAHDSASGRLMIWKLGLDLVKDAPLLGYGTGDAKDVLIDSYQKAGFTYGAERKLNAHNQFLQTVLAVGIPGLLLLLWVFAEAIRNREPVFIAWMLVFSLNALTESVLETQKGVLFVSVFYALLRPSFIQPPQKRS